MLELRHLRLLLALKATGSLALAAESLHLTASAVSHQLKELESHYGLTLVNRRMRPLGFSPAGLELLLLAQRILPDVERVHTTLKRMAHGQIGRLRLASECHSCFDWLMPILNRYRNRWADVDLDFATGFEPEPHHLLLEGESDILITSSPLALDGITYLPLFRYESRLVLSPKHPLARKKTITPQDLANETLISYPVEQRRLDIMAHFLLPSGVMPAHHRTTELTAMLIQLIASERGVGALPDWVVAEYEQKGWVKSRPLGAGLFCQLYAAVRSQDIQIAYIQGFLTLLSGVLKPNTSRARQLNLIQYLPNHQP